MSVFTQFYYIALTFPGRYMQRHSVFNTLMHCLFAVTLIRDWENYVRLLDIPVTYGSVRPSPIYCFVYLSVHNPSLGVIKGSFASQYCYIMRDNFFSCFKAAMYRVTNKVKKPKCPLAYKFGWKLFFRPSHVKTSHSWLQKFYTDYLVDK